MALARGGGDTLWAATAGAARLWRSTDTRASWSLAGEIPPAGIEIVHSVLAPPGGPVMAGIFLGPPLWASGDAGATWTQGNQSERGAGYSLHRGPDGIYYAGVWIHASTAGVYRSTDGVNWSATAGTIPGTYADLKVLAFADDGAGTLYAGIGTKSSGELVFSTTDGGGAWVSTGTLAGAREVLALLRSGDGALYAGTSPNGGIYRLGTPVSVDPGGAPPAALAIRAVPNPAAPGVRFELTGLSASAARVGIFAVDGRLVRTLQGTAGGQGAEFRLVWDGLTEDGRLAAAGVYFARLENERAAPIRFVLVR
jgi:hypothetical protein